MNDQTPAPVKVTLQGTMTERPSKVLTIKTSVRAGAHLRPRPWRC